MSLASSHQYETIYILRPSTSEADATTIHQKLDSVIGKFGGTLQSREDWGLRELAFEIDDQTNGRYVVIHYNGNTGVVEEIERHFKILDDVIRYITIQVPKTYDYSKIKKQMALSEEDNKRSREARKKGPGGDMREMRDMR